MMQHTFDLKPFRRPIIGLLVMLTLIALLTACAPAAQPAEAPTQAPAATEAPTQAPAATEAPTQAPAATEAPTQAPEATEAPTVAPAPAATVSFAADVKPLLDQRCINCHGGKDGTRGGLSMRSYDDLMKGGESGAAIVPGNPASSLLVELIDAGDMPKRAPRLPQSEIDVIIAWVAAGAKND